MFMVVYRRQHTRYAQHTTFGPFASRREAREWGELCMYAPWKIVRR